jgi:hypothetical protein
LARCDPQRARQRQPEHGKAVGHADAQMDAERSGWYEPSIEARRSDDAIAIEDARRSFSRWYGPIESRRHENIPWVGLSLNPYRRLTSRARGTIARPTPVVWTNRQQRSGGRVADRGRPWPRQETLRLQAAERLLTTELPPQPRTAPLPPDTQPSPSEPRW